MVPTQRNSPLAVSLIHVDGKVIRLVAEVLASSAVCPTCHRSSSLVHDRYVRQPLDLPWRGHTVRFCLTVRRFRCANRTCPRHTFTETVGDHLPRHARRTTAATETLLDLARSNGGEGGARVVNCIGLPTSPDTLLRLLRQQRTACLHTPRVLGVDDFALRRRQRYGTLLVDLETHEPVDILEGREAAVLATWLREHLGVEIIVRDRAEAYAEGAAQGAPDAQQVADRFHLVQNASTALEEVLRSRRRYLEASAQPTPDSTGELEPALPERAPGPTKQQELARRARRVGRWRKVHELRADGWNVSQIARELGMHRRTVRHYLATPIEPRNRVTRPRPGGLTSPTLQPYLAYLQERWAAGCRNISQLYRELEAKGYTASRSLLAQALKPWRPPRAPTRGRRRNGRPRRVNLRWLCLRCPEQLAPDEKVILEKFLAEDTEVARGYDLLQRFRRIIRERAAEELEGWLDDARTSGLEPFRVLAHGIVGDRLAVEAALRTEWSNGPTEGLVNRIKLIKRQGYGRAKLDLLRSRVLAA